MYKIINWRGRKNKASEWDLANPIWQGRLQIVTTMGGNYIDLRYLEKDGKIFLKSIPIPVCQLSEETNPLHTYFDMFGVIDSSRYFIFWVETPTQQKRRIPFAFGFTERQVFCFVLFCFYFI